LEEEEPYHNKFAGSPFVDFGMDFRWNVVVVGLGVDTAHHQSDLHCHSAGNTAAAAVVVDSVAHVRLVDSTAADAVAVADSGVGVVPCSGNSDGTGTVVVDRVAGGGGCTGRDAVGAVVVVPHVDILPPPDQSLPESIEECPSSTDDCVRFVVVCRIPEPTVFRSSLSCPSQKSDCPTLMDQSQY
jgi:hypothetical protein